MPLRFTSCQAPIAEAFCAAVATWLGRRLGLPVELVDGVAWPERLRAFDAGRIDVCWMCGLPYVWRADGRAPVELLAAPVMAGERYGGRPVYFSDVVVRADTPWSSFADLRGARWAYNEDTSHSGYNAVRGHLAGLGAAAGYFGSVEATGSHEASLALLLAGAIDASAIDSTVLEMAQRRDPSLAVRLRTIATLGPSPIPPWVVGRHVPSGLRQALRDGLLALATDPEGQAILDAGLAAGFAAVTDADYDPVRRMAREAAGIAL